MFVGGLDYSKRYIGDCLGGVPSPSGQKFEYDEGNRLKTVRRASDDAVLLNIRIDALDRQVESADHTAVSDPCYFAGGSGSGGAGFQPVRTRHVAAGIETLAEFIECPSGSPPATAWVKAREFVWGAAFPEPLAMIDWTEAGAAASGTAEALHYVHQHLGSPAALTNAGNPGAAPPLPGEVVERYTYDPYGRTTIENLAGTRLTSGGVVIVTPISLLPCGVSLAPIRGLGWIFGGSAATVGGVVAYD